MSTGTQRFVSIAEAGEKFEDKPEEKPRRCS